MSLRQVASPSEERVSDSELRLYRQVAIVTGGGSGIGRAACLELQKEGASVVVVDRDAARVDAVSRSLEDERLRHDLPGSTLSLALDVRREDDMEAMVRQTRERFGRLDVLIASAGILRSPGSSLKPVVDTAASEWDQVIEVNLKGVFLSNRAVLPTLIEQRRGQIINLSSTAGRQGRAFDSAYCASKFGVIGFSESLAQEVSRYGVRVHVVLPDAVDTPLWEQNGPLPRPPDALPPERVASLLVYLLTLPDDCMLVGPVIAPFRTRRRGAVNHGDDPSSLT